MLAAVNARDVEAILACWAHDGLLMPPDHPAVERLTYTAVATPLAGGPPTEDVGKGLHVYGRRPDGTWQLTQDIWNSDRPRATPA